MFYPHLFGDWRTANGRPYNVLSTFVRLLADGQWLSLNNNFKPIKHCSLLTAHCVKG